MHVGETDNPRYRNRKSKVTTNVLGVCDQNINFIFVLLSWEGSTSNSRVIRDVITRLNGLRVPTSRHLFPKMWNTLIYDNIIKRHK